MPSMEASLQSITSTAEFETALARASKVVLFFWASWSAPCSHMNTVLEALAAAHTNVTFLKVEAEEVDDVTERFGVTAVPHFVLLQDGKPVGSVAGADAPALTTAVQQFAAAAGTKGAATALAPPPLAPPSAQAPSVEERIKVLLSSSPVVLFMKGNAAAPYCGFSRRTVEALRSAGASAFTDVDILRDEELRQGLKQYSNWPTFPQLYVAGELIGGCDIVCEMEAAGELTALLRDKAPTCLLAPAAAGTAATGSGGSQGSQQQQQQPAAAAAAAAAAAGGLTPALRSRLQALLTSSPVMLFMKGQPDAPRCGFSRKVVDALRSAGLTFGSFDILEDEEVRQGLKQLSNWPTYPQLYAGGELLGGCDIILELAAAGELGDAVKDAVKSTQ